MRRARRRGIRFLHPTDFSPASERAEVEAARWARAVDAEIVVLHVVPALEACGGGRRARIADVLALEAARRVAAERQVRARAAALRRRGLRATWAVLSGTPHREIVALARRLGPAAIVMGTRGRGGVAGWLLGSTARRVVRLAACPVLTVRA